MRLGHPLAEVRIDQKEPDFHVFRANLDGLLNRSRDRGRAAATELPPREIVWQQGFEFVVMDGVEPFPNSATSGQGRQLLLAARMHGDRSGDRKREPVEAVWPKSQLI